MHPSYFYKDGTFPKHVSLMLERLKNEPETESIWLIGSRANGTANADSDWDFLAFVNDPVSERPARVEEVDVLRVDPEERCLLEWQLMSLSNSFETWHWRQTGLDRAKYMVRDTPESVERTAFDLADVQFRELRAIKVWGKNA